LEQLYSLSKILKIKEKLENQMPSPYLEAATVSKIKASDLCRNERFSNMNDVIKLAAIRG